MSRAERPNVGASLETVAGTSLAGLGLVSLLSKTLLANNIPPSLERLIPKSLERNGELALSLCLWAVSATAALTNRSLVTPRASRK